MTDAPSRAVRLYGTDEPVTPPRVLRAGALSAELEGGNLRYIRFDGAEALRAVSFIVRDKDWGTYNPLISDLRVEESDARFIVTLNAMAADDQQSFAYSARIEGHSDGRLTFHGRGVSETGFLTNRTGFVVLHPIDGVAGAPVTITHTDGRSVKSRFPEIIDPVQPMMDLRALTHVSPAGLTVETLMEGDTFEMEDQRNWTDASYKTYVRPLALPWPYRLAPGEIVDQTVTATVSGAVTTETTTATISVAPGDKRGAMPPLGLGLRPEDVVATMSQVETLRALAPGYVVLHHDPRASHDRKTLEAQVSAAQALGADPWLEVVIAATDNAAAAAEVAALGAIAAALGHPFATVLVSPAPDLKCTLPGSPWPPAPDAAKLYAATRAAFPGARVGGGMFSYFTELNRKRPPDGALDLISFTTSPTIHAGDDRSVMETHEAHPAIVASVNALAKGKPWAVGPSAIGVRDNPYGASAKENLGNIRQAMNFNDPRQRGLLGAVWALGYIANFASGGAKAVAVGGATGPFGVVSTKAAWPQPWYDAHGGVFPVFHVLRGLGRLKGSTMRTLGLPPSAAVTGLAGETGVGVDMWIGNTGDAPVDIEITLSRASAAVLDATSFVAAAKNLTHMDSQHPMQSSVLHLDGFALTRVSGGNILFN